LSSAIILKLECTKNLKCSPSTVFVGDASGNARRWVIGSAWPYIYAVPHLGNLIGSVLSADVFTRYLRLKGDDVIFVSGSDEHGTPIEVEALQLGIKPKELTDRMHEIVKRLFELWEISFDASLTYNAYPSLSCPLPRCSPLSKLPCRACEL